MWQYINYLPTSRKTFVFVFVFISLSIDPLQGQRPHGYRNSQVA